MRRLDTSLKILDEEGNEQDTNGMIKMKKRGGRREGGKTAALEERRRKGNKKIKKEQGEGNNQGDKESRRERWRKSSVQNKWLNK